MLLVLRGDHRFDGLAAVGFRGHLPGHIVLRRGDLGKPASAAFHRGNLPIEPLDHGLLGERVDVLGLQDGVSTEREDHVGDVLGPQLGVEQTQTLGADLPVVARLQNEHRRLLGNQVDELFGFAGELPRLDQFFGVELFADERVAEQLPTDARVRREELLDLLAEVDLDRTEGDDVDQTARNQPSVMVLQLNGGSGQHHAVDQVGSRRGQPDGEGATHAFAADDHLQSFVLLANALGQPRDVVVRVLDVADFRSRPVGVCAPETAKVRCVDDEPVKSQPRSELVVEQRVLGEAVEQEYDTARVLRCVSPLTHRGHETASDGGVVVSRHLRERGRRRRDEAGDRDSRGQQSVEVHVPGHRVFQFQ